MPRQCKVCFLGYTRLTPLAEKVIKNLPPSNVEYVLMECRLESQAECVERARQMGCEVFIAGPGNAAEFTQNYTYSLVEIPIKHIDYAIAVKKAKQLGAKKIAIVSHRYSQAPDVSMLAELMDTTLELTKYEDTQQIYELIEKSECDVVIGASLGNDAAAAAGKKSVLLYSGEEAIRDACIRAGELAKEIHQTKRSQLIARAVMNNAQFGIIVTDVNGRVERFNRAAGSYTGLTPNEIRGRQLTDYFPNLSQEVLLSGEHRQANSYRLIQGSMMRCTQEKIMLDGEPTAVLTTIHPDSHNRRKALSQSNEKFTSTVQWTDLVAKSSEMKKAIETGKELALLDMPTVIIGMPGTGRRSFAECIHNASGRSEHLCMLIDLAAIAGEDAARVLFGYERDGCTTAGLLMGANHGTVILRNIALAAPVTQACMMRALEERHIFRPGMEEPISHDINFITLAAPAEIKKIPAELMSKLCVMSVELPPLAKRADDLPELFKNLLASEMELPRKMTVTEEMARLLMFHKWSGNLHELQMVCRRYSVYYSRIAEPIKLNYYLLLIQAIGADIIFEEIIERYPALKNAGCGSNSEFIEGIDAVKQALKYNNDTIAEKLGMSRTTLWRMYRHND